MRHRRAARGKTQTTKTNTPRSTRGRRITRGLRIWVATKPSISEPRRPFKSCQNTEDALTMYLAAYKIEPTADIFEKNNYFKNGIYKTLKNTISNTSYVSSTS